MDKLNMKTPDNAEKNIEQIEALSSLFPNVITETRDEEGKVKKAVDFDLLRQMLSKDLVEDGDERYRLDWPGKKASLLKANTPITKTLRPCREESVNFDTTENLYIEGDNFEVLKILQESYLGKVKMIYIDPPYNTGKDFIYRDDFKQNREEYEDELGVENDEGEKLFRNTDSRGRFHSDWLSMMYQRLIIARDLLNDDGVVLISIDENEHHNLRKIADEVFGPGNFCGDIIWKNSSKNDQDYVSIQHEYFILYVKDKSSNIGKWVELKQGLPEIYKAFNGFKKKFKDDYKAIHQAALEWYGQFPASNPIVDNKHYSWMDENGVYFASDISGPNHGQYVYDVKHPVSNLVCKSPASGWRYPEEEMKRRINENLVHFGEDHLAVPKNKTYLKNTEFQSLTSMKYQDGRAASKRLESMFGNKVFTNPKDEILLSDFFNALDLNHEDIVLDFFAGSGTTAHAVFNFNTYNKKRCRFILIQIAENLYQILKTATGSSKKVTQNAIDILEHNNLPTTISEICKERIRRAGKKILEENADKLKDRESLLDIGFRVYKTDSSNMKDVFYHPSSIKQDQLDFLESNIKEDRTPEDLLTQVLLDLGLELSLPIEQKKIKGNAVFFVQTNALVACFDNDIDFEIIDEIAKIEPLKVVFKDASFQDDKDRINVEERFKRLSPETKISVL